jgi:short subunit dehydrogenase-like uncharacterized protein
MAEREFDVVVFGATGVTGKRVAAYLADQSAATGAKWAAAARDLTKLDRVLGQEGVDAPESITADLGDEASLAAMAKRTKVVIDMVGPYTLYGRPVIKACVENGAHYLDLTGEIPFARRMIDEFDAGAREAGVKVVEVCGFEALPPDLCVRLAAEAAKERHGEGLSEVDLEIATKQPSGFVSFSDLLSGGTMQSMAEATGDPDSASLADPATLIPDETPAEAVRARSPIKVAPRGNGRGGVIAPMTPAAFINPAVIHRSQYLAATAAGEPFLPFQYREGIVIPGAKPTLPFRYAAAGMLSGMQAGMRAAARARPSVRKRAAGAMRKILPSSGFGPDNDKLEDWSWKVRVDARTPSGKEVTVTLEAEGQPGYLTTARMIGEAALMLAEDGLTPDASGCLTPSAALGTEHVDRFERAQMRFAVAD